MLRFLLGISIPTHQMRADRPFERARPASDQNRRDSMLFPV